MDEDDARARMARHRELRELIATHPGQAAHKRWNAIRRTVDMHQRNLTELMQLLDAVGENPMFAMELVQNVRAPTVREEFTAQLDQRLHNAMGSAITAVDHIRRLVGDYAETSFAAEYERRNSQIAGDDRTAFIRRLRNYLLHVETLPFTYNFSFSNVPEPSASGAVRLSTKTMFAWDGWTAGAVRYLNSAGDTIDLRDLIQWYTEVSVDLYSWLFDQFPPMHSDEVDQLNDLISEMNALFPHADDDEPSAGNSRLATE